MDMLYYPVLIIITLLAFLTPSIFVACWSLKRIADALERKDFT